MLDTVRPPLVLDDFAEHTRAAIEELFNDFGLGGVLEILERVLLEE
jgi:hypothetical protein